MLSIAPGREERLAIVTEALLAHATLDVPDISCGHCVQTVTGALTPLAGVEEVSVDLPGKTVAVAYDPRRVTLERIQEVLAAEDYPVAAVRRSS
jgi:copper chaperone